LAFAHHPGWTVPVTVKAGYDRRLVSAAGGDITLTSDVEARLAETTRDVDGEGTARVGFRYTGFAYESAEPAEAPAAKALERAMRRVSGTLTLARRGNLVRDEADFGRVPDDARGEVTELHDLVRQALRVLAVPLPNETVAPGRTWKAQHPLPFDRSGRSRAGAVDVTYTYAGTKMRDGYQVAEVSLEGVAHGRPGREGNVRGESSGYALVDLATGQVFRADAWVSFTWDTDWLGGSARCNITLRVTVERALRKGGRPPDAR
jgi:hypothetical protein